VYRGALNTLIVIVIVIVYKLLVIPSSNFRKCLFCSTALQNTQQQYSYTLHSEFIAALDELLVYCSAGKPYTCWSSEEKSIVVEYFSEWVTGKHKRGLPGEHECLANDMFDN